jgi:hypothetical protein
VYSTIIDFKWNRILFLVFSPVLHKTFSLLSRDGGHEQLIINCGRLKPDFVGRVKKQIMIDLREISTNRFMSLHKAF